MSPPVTFTTLLASYEPGQRLRCWTLNVLAGMMPRGSIRKGVVVRDVQSANGVWSARCVQWSAGPPIWEILASNPYSRSHA